jgi:hypothetical protein
LKLLLTNNVPLRIKLFVMRDNKLLESNHSAAERILVLTNDTTPLVVNARTEKRVCDDTI